MAEGTTKTVKTFRGVVVGVAGDKTLAVVLIRYIKHPKYGKYFSVKKKFLVHCDDCSKYNVGDVIDFVSCAPISKLKKFKVVS